MKTTKTLFGILTITTALAMNGRSQTCAPVTSGLIDWWPGNGNANDVAGTNNGTMPDEANVTFTGGEVGQAFSFTGVSPNGNDTGNEVDFGTNAGNFGTNDFTIDFWIKQPTNATGQYGILEKRTTCNATYSFLDIHLGHNPGLPTTIPGGLLFDFTGNGMAGYALLYETNKTINDGFFHHAAFVRNGTNLSIYIDGILDASNAATTGIANINNSDVLRVGQSVCVGTDTSEPFVGELDELDLYSRALSPEEIYTIYQAGSAGKCGTPTITTQPQSLVVNANQAATFNVVAALPRYYQWLFNGTNISGATSSSLTISNVVQTNLGMYSVFITNAYGSVTSSNATLSMYPFLVTPFEGLDTDWGYTNILSVAAWGSGPLSYQWYQNGNALDGATNQTLDFTGIQFTNGGLYTVVVSDTFGSVTNTPEQVVVNPAGVSLGFSPTVTISGVAGYSYIIQSTTNLANTNAWVTVTNLTLTQAVQQWVDTNVDASSPLHPTRYYQVLPGQ